MADPTTTETTTVTPPPPESVTGVEPAAVVEQTAANAPAAADATTSAIPGMKVAEDLNKTGTDITQALSDITWGSWGTAALYVVGGFIIASFIGSLCNRILPRYTSNHYTQIFRRLSYYSIIIISLLLAISTLHLDMKVLGIATVLTLAIGFASKSAASNIISGLFLVFEKPFEVGDHLEIDGVLGELLSIDLLSIKILTYENSLLRIPNESLLQTNFINLTKFPIRRLDTLLRIDLNADMDKVRKVLFDCARKNPLALESPPPQLLFVEFNESAIVFKFAVWVKRQSFNELKHSLPVEIQKDFLANEIRLPVSQIKMTSSPF